MSDRREHEPATVRVMRNSTILAALSVFNMVSGAVATVLLAYLLTVEDLGIFGAAFRGYSWLAAFAVFLLPPVLVRYVAELKGAQREGTAWRLLYRSLAVQAATVVFLVLLAIPLWSIFGGELPLGWTAIGIILLAFAAYGFSQLFEAFLRGWQDFGAVAAGLFAGGAARLVGLGILFLLGGTVAGALGVLAAGNIAALVVLLWIIVRMWRRDYQPDAPRNSGRPLRKRLIEYGASMGVAGLLSLVIWNYVEVFFLGWFWREEPGVEAELAFYTLAISLSMLPIRIGKSVAQALLPAFSELYGSGEIERLRRGYRQATVLGTLVGVFLCGLGIALAEPLFRVLFPAELLPAVRPFQLLLIPALLITINHAGGAALPALEGHRFFLGSVMVLVPVNIALDFLLIPGGGAVGAAGVNAIVQSLAVASGLWYVSVRRRLGFPATPVLLALLAGALAGGAAWGCSWGILQAGLHPFVALCAGGLAGVLVYLAAVRSFRVLSAADRGVLLSAEAMLPRSLRPMYRHLCTAVLGT